ncbi:MAG: XTP/dITP diphosphatase [bacterium]|nr:XTP/dITP diphosphatase [bacterium]
MSKQKLLVATNNKDKFKEITAILDSLNVEFVSLGDIELPEEDGKTIEENAIKKSEFGFEIKKMLTIADDTGLEVDALNGAPGVYSSRFAGENVSYEDNRKKLLNELAGKKLEERKAKFRCIIAVSGLEKGTKTFEGSVDGYITEDERGNSGFGYDAIFFVPEIGKTMAEMSPEEKNKISHRGRAIVKAKKYLENYLN